ncbi:MAG: DNA gyrase inhibitor YacG [Novosphingobium sp.]|nr:DNA gyrase inhibitor YacG [Novosphingobium sp.]MCP5402821.1 DNA gyrase inhibitor YacG [Novosphingobium sp.]
MTQPQRKCPICGKPRVEKHAPFCSSRCRDRDLVKWLDDGYSLPGPAAPPDIPPEE